MKDDSDQESRNCLCTVEKQPPSASQPADWVFLQPAILDQMHDSIIVTDLQGKVTGCNRASTHLYEYSAQELIGQSASILHLPEDAELLRAEIIPAVLRHGEYRGEQRNRTRSGGTIYTHLSVTLLRDGDGNPAGMVGFSLNITQQKLGNLAIKRQGEVERHSHWMAIQRDITEQKELREQLAQNQSRLHFLTESIAQLLWTASREGRFEFVSQACAKFVGVTPAELHGEGWYQFVHPEDLARTTQVWKEAVAGHHPFVVEYRMRRQDGVYIWFLHRAVPRLSDANEVLEWIGSSTDIEQQKRSEEAIRLTEKLAAVGRLASSIAHEINNPLASVTNLLYLLSTQESLSKTAREYVHTAQEELARVSETTTQTLRFHRQSTSSSPTRIAEVLDSVLVFYRPRLASSGLTVVREYERTQQLTCFSGEIRQAFSNLIGNAIEASQPGGRLRIRLRNAVTWKLRKRRGIRITIGDTGHGISKELIPLIFEPFYTTKGHTGTGLGLWITKDLIAKHDGRISLRSSTQPGRSGTVISILLPFEPL